MTLFTSIFRGYLANYCYDEFTGHIIEYDCYGGKRLVDEDILDFLEDAIRYYRSMSSGSTVWDTGNFVDRLNSIRSDISSERRNNKLNNILK